MCRGLLGKKLGMTGVFTPQGRYVPVTVLQVGPCVVTQVKTTETDGYNAVQLGFEAKKASRVNKPMQGHLKKSAQEGFVHLREVEVEDPQAYSPGQTVDLEMFKVGDRVDIIGTTKGRGYQGVVKRHGFHGGKDTHGSHSHRVPGSIGCSAWPSKVIKGKKLPGQYGNDRKTVRNLEIVDVRPGENILMIKGAIPGYRSGLVLINKPKFQK